MPEEDCTLRLAGQAKARAPLAAEMGPEMGKTAVSAIQKTPLPHSLSVVNRRDLTDLVIEPAFRREDSLRFRGACR
jgi:hypothetical protein